MSRYTPETKDEDKLGKLEWSENQVHTAPRSGWINAEAIEVAMLGTTEIIRITHSEMFAK